MLNFQKNLQFKYQYTIYVTVGQRVAIDTTECKFLICINLTINFIFIQFFKFFIMIQNKI